MIMLICDECGMDITHQVTERLGKKYKETAKPGKDGFKEASEEFHEELNHLGSMLLYSLINETLSQRMKPLTGFNYLGLYCPECGVKVRQRMRGDLKEVKAMKHFGEQFGFLIA